MLTSTIQEIHPVDELGRELNAFGTTLNWFKWPISSDNLKLLEKDPGLLHCFPDTPTSRPTASEEPVVKRYIELACAWGGIGFAVLFGIGFVGIARFVPPLLPSDSAEQIAAIFREDTGSIRTGLLICYIGCAFYLAFGASISAQTRRIPGVPTTLIHLQLVAFAASVLLIAGPLMIWWVAAYRPDETSVEMIRMLNDFGWISFLIGWVPFVTWYVATGLSILCDTGAEPLYPRWAGYLGIVLGLGQTSASFLIYFKTGPFAWNGIFGWWLPATEFFIWFVVITALTVKAINKQYRAGTGAAGSATVPAGTAGS